MYHGMLSLPRKFWSATGLTPRLSPAGLPFPLFNSSIPLYTHSYKRTEKGRARLMEEKAKKEKENTVPQDKFLETRSVMLTGEINMESADKVIRQLLVLENESDEPIRMFINSPGGDVNSGLAIYDMVKFIRNDVFMIGTGLIASAATLVLLAVDPPYRFGLPNSTYLIHQPMSEMQGVATDVEIYTKQLEKTKDRLNRIISDQTGQPLDIVANDTDRDYWLDSAGALEYNLITKIITKREEL